jgi:hypothetical protein
MSGRRERRRVQTAEDYSYAVWAVGAFQLLSEPLPGDGYMEPEVEEKVSKVSKEQIIARFPGLKAPMDLVDAINGSGYGAFVIVLADTWRRMHPDDRGLEGLKPKEFRPPPN